MVSSVPRVHGVNRVAWSHVTRTSGQELTVSGRGPSTPSPSWKPRLADSRDLASWFQGRTAGTVPTRNRPHPSWHSVSHLHASATDTDDLSPSVSQKGNRLWRLGPGGSWQWCHRTDCYIFRNFVSHFLLVYNLIRSVKNQGRKYWKTHTS